MEAGHYDSMVYLRLWKGDLNWSNNLAMEKGELTDHLLILAPMGKTSGSKMAWLNKVLLTCKVQNIK